MDRDDDEGLPVLNGVRLLKRKKEGEEAVEGSVIFYSPEERRGGEGGYYL